MLLYLQTSFGSQLYDVDDDFDGGFDGDDIDVKVDGNDVVVQVDGDDAVEEVVGHLGRQLDLSGSGSHPSGSVRHKIYSLPNIFCQRASSLPNFCCH